MTTIPLVGAEILELPEHDPLSASTLQKDPEVEFMDNGIPEHSTPLAAPTAVNDNKPAEDSSRACDQIKLNTERHKARNIRLNRYSKSIHKEHTPISTINRIKMYIPMLFYCS